jgi:hypothetical protein
LNVETKSRSDFRKVKFIVYNKGGYGVFFKCHVGGKGWGLTKWGSLDICLYIRFKNLQITNAKLKNLPTLVYMLCKWGWALWELGHHSTLPHKALITFNFAPLGFTLHLFQESPILRLYLINIFFIFDVHVLFTPNVFLSKRNFPKMTNVC